MDKILKEDFYERAAMRVILQSLVEEEVARFDELNQIPHEYSEESMKRIKGILRRDKAKRGLQKTLVYAKKVAICASVALLLFLAACAAVKPLREKMAEAFITWYDKYAAISYPAEEAERKLMLPTVIPGGYVETNRQESADDFDLYLIYQNDKGNRIIFLREEDGENNELYVDREHATMTEIDFRGGQAVYMEPQQESFPYSLIWQEGGTVYCICAEESKELLFEFVENVK